MKRKKEILIEVTLNTPKEWTNYKINFENNLLFEILLYFKFI